MGSLSSSSVISVPTKQSDGGGDKMKRPKRVFGESSSEPEQHSDKMHSHDIRMIFYE